MRADTRERRSSGTRTAVLASADGCFRQRVREALCDLRWQVREAQGGAETLACLDASPAEAVVLDSWLPDLEIQEFIAEFRRLHPETDLVMANASAGEEAGRRSPRRNEVLYALRRAQAGNGATTGPESAGIGGRIRGSIPGADVDWPLWRKAAGFPEVTKADAAAVAALSGTLPEFVGSDPALLELSRRIRLVARRKSPVLIEGPTGSGKELVARALHRLSGRGGKRLVALNCAAIPETLLEAELFGHTRGAFTGAVQGRTGRIEAADGGTLLLDEIGEMPLGLQAKLLRFLETGELQRVGENEPVEVDVRIVAATHRPLAKMTAEGTFRGDLYYRLAVFLIRTPALAGRSGDIRAITDWYLERLAKDEPAKRIADGALEQLLSHAWPGNVRELEHVLERAWILAEDRPEIGVDEIEFDEPK
jgi:DNA-binding NtrC family response regulator